MGIEKMVRLGWIGLGVRRGSRKLGQNSFGFGHANKLGMDIGIVCWSAFFTCIPKNKVLGRFFRYFGDTLSSVEIAFLSSFSPCVSLSVGGRTFRPCDAAYSLCLKKTSNSRIFRIN